MSSLFSATYLKVENYLTQEGAKYNNFPGFLDLYFIIIQEKGDFYV